MRPPLAEQTSIAREIHDILAHSLADLCIQLEVADALLTDNADVAGAVRQVRRAHRLAEDGLRETRRAVYALRRDTPPLPDTLAVMAAACGQAVFRLQGSPRPLPAAAGLALVRTAQEALVNARKYAAGLPINLCLQYATDRVGLTVTDGQPSTTGNGSGSVPPTPSGELDGGLRIGPACVNGCDLSADRWPPVRFRAVGRSTPRSRRERRRLAGGGGR